MPRAKAPKSPFPQRQGVDAVRLRMPGLAEAGELPWRTIGEFLRDKLPIADADLSRLLRDGHFRYADNTAVRASDAYRLGFIWVERDFPQETPMEPPPVLYRDERIIVVDKPHFMACSPQGAHLTQTVQALTRVTHDVPAATIAHRLDRVTAGVLLLTVNAEYRKPYQTMFPHKMRKTYLAVVHSPPSWSEVPRGRVSHLVKTHAQMQVVESLDKEPNAETRFEVLSECGDYSLVKVTPLTGRTHQIRVHLAALGIPIVNDPLYPVVTDRAGDISVLTDPLQLLAAELAFTDPIDNTERSYFSARHLSEWSGDWPTPAGWVI